GVGDYSITKWKDIVALELSILSDVEHVEHLRQDFETALNVKSHPAAVDLYGRIVPTELVQIRQTPEIERLDKGGPGVTEVQLRAITRQRQPRQVQIEPRPHEIEVSRLNQWPIEQAIVLVPVRATPRPKVWVVILRGRLHRGRYVMPDGKQ